MTMETENRIEYKVNPPENIQELLDLLIYIQLEASTELKKELQTLPEPKQGQSTFTGFTGEQHTSVVRRQKLLLDIEKYDEMINLLKILSTRMKMIEFLLYLHTQDKESITNRDINELLKWYDLEYISSDYSTVEQLFDNIISQQMHTSKHEQNTDEKQIKETERLMKLANRIKALNRMVLDFIELTPPKTPAQLMNSLSNI